MKTNKQSTTSWRAHRGQREASRRTGRNPEHIEESVLDHPLVKSLESKMSRPSDRCSCYDDACWGFWDQCMYCDEYDQICHNLMDAHDTFSGGAVYIADSESSKGAKRNKTKWNKRPEHPQHTPLKGEDLKRYYSSKQRASRHGMYKFEDETLVPEDTDTSWKNYEDYNDDNNFLMSLFCDEEVLMDELWKEEDMLRQSSGLIKGLREQIIKALKEKLVVAVERRKEAEAMIQMIWGKRPKQTLSLYI